MSVTLKKTRRRALRAEGVSKRQRKLPKINSVDSLTKWSILLKSEQTIANTINKKKRSFMKQEIQTLEYKYYKSNNT